VSLPYQDSEFAEDSQLDEESDEREREHEVSTRGINLCIPPLSPASWWAFMEVAVFDLIAN
jgi:hypothetical protein